MNIEKCKQLIFWSNVGFADQLLEKIREQKSAVLDSATIISELDDYFVELRKVFYEISDKFLIGLCRDWEFLCQECLVQAIHPLKEMLQRLVPVRT